MVGHRGTSYATTSFSSPSSADCRPNTLAKMMMNMKLKHVLFLAISVGVIVYFVDYRYFNSSSTTDGIESSSHNDDDDDDDDVASLLDPVDDANIFEERRGNANFTSILNADDQLPDPVSLDVSSEGENAHIVDNIESDRADSKIEVSDSNPPTIIHVVMVLKDAATNPNLQRKFDITVASIFAHTSVGIQWHVFGDDKSLNFAQKTLERDFSSLPFDRRRQFSSELQLYNLDDVEKKIGHNVDILMKYFTGRHTYYKHSIFFLSTVLHKILDPSISRIIMIDADLKFMTDIKSLHDLFNEFSPEAAIGIGYEMQPVYRHLLWSYRNSNKGTKVGEPVGSGGNPGFNSGVLLMDLDKLRNSQLYELLNKESTIQSYVSKYSFENAHLGDQDFYTLTSFEHPEFYYRLPCAWNRQLCRWWEDKGYQEIFHEYFDCHQKVHLYHGNCDTPIPA